MHTPRMYLANQVAAIAVEYGEIERSRIRNIIGRTSLFSGDDKLLDDVCSQLKSTGS